MLSAYILCNISKARMQLLRLLHFCAEVFLQLLREERLMGRPAAVSCGCECMCAIRQR
jgi:hypothetical protein